MKKFILPVVLGILLSSFPGCSKNKGCEANSPSSEAPQMLNFAVANNINVTTHPSGLIYEVISQGSGATASPYSKIYITYTGKLMDGTVFDQQNTPNADGWPLSGLIEGWRIGIPLIQKGGRIKLIIPSALAYGCQPYKTLPANAILYFDITLVDLQ